MVTIPRKFSDDEIALASRNYESQERLMRRMQGAFDMRGKTYAEVSTELGRPEAETEEMLNGEVDMTLSELAELATAVDAQIEYRVKPLATHYRAKFDQINDHASWEDATTWPTPTHAS